MSTPGVSAVIRGRGKGFEAFGGFILTASHNPGGIEEDFGIKYNCENGGPAPESLTDLIYKHTTSITSIQTCAHLAKVDLSKTGVTTFDGFSVEVFDSTSDHVAALTKCFDFAAIKALVSRPGPANSSLPRCPSSSDWKEGNLAGSAWKEGNLAGSACRMTLSLTPNVL